jgi:hypothetical protein
MFKITLVSFSFFNIRIYSVYLSPFVCEFRNTVQLFLICIVLVKCAQATRLFLTLSLMLKRRVIRRTDRRVCDRSAAGPILFFLGAFTPVAKSTCYLRHVRPSVLLSVRIINRAPKEQICAKFYNGDFCKNLSRTSKIG